jgi:hypothetical protein
LLSDLPYQPPFDFELPDYKEVGRKIQDLAFSMHFDDAPGPPDREFLVNELESIEWENFPLVPLGNENICIRAPHNSSTDVYRIHSLIAGFNLPSRTWGLPVAA